MTGNPSSRTRRILNHAAHTPQTGYVFPASKQRKASLRK